MGLFLPATKVRKITLTQLLMYQHVTSILSILFASFEVKHPHNKKREILQMLPLQRVFLAFLLVAIEF
jgi:hypothetical protein